MRRCDSYITTLSNSHFFVYISPLTMTLINLGVAASDRVHYTTTWSTPPGVNNWFSYPTQEGRCSHTANVYARCCSCACSSLFSRSCVTSADSANSCPNRLTWWTLEHTKSSVQKLFSLLCLTFLLLDGAAGSLGGHTRFFCLHGNAAPLRSHAGVDGQPGLSLQPHDGALDGVIGQRQRLRSCTYV